MSALKYPSPRAVVVAIALSFSAASRAEPAEWAMLPFDGPTPQRAGLLVTAQIDGHPCQLQLDTGMNSAIAWHYYEQAKQPPVRVTVKFAGITRQVDAPADWAGTWDQCQGVVGSLGNAFFEQGTLNVDLGTPAVHYQAAARLADAADALPMIYARWSDEGGHPLVEVRMQGGGVGYGLLDTGTAVGIGVLTAARWKRLTDDAPLKASDTVRMISMHAWGRNHDCYRAQGRQALQVGLHPIAVPDLLYCPTLGFKSPVHLDGVIGMRHFGDATLVLDYLSGRWRLQLASPQVP